MIDELDETLRALLIRDLKIEDAEVAVAFEQPKREWAARLLKPTLNLFLYNVRENVLMRQMAPTEMKRNGTTSMMERKGPLRVDLSYMITAWAGDPQDEHRMLARTLLVLSRYLTLPTDLLSEDVKAEGVPVHVQVARDEMNRATELWGAMDNELRPALTMMITAPLNPYYEFTSPLIRTVTVDTFDRDHYIPRKERVYDDRRPTSDTYPRNAQDHERMNLPRKNSDRITLDPASKTSSRQRGVLLIETEVRVEQAGVIEVITQRVVAEHARLTVLETNQTIYLTPADKGVFTLTGLWPGEFQVDIATEGAAPVRQTFNVPSPSGTYEFVVKADALIRQ